MGGVRCHWVGGAIALSPRVSRRRMGRAGARRSPSTSNSCGFLEGAQAGLSWIDGAQQAPRVPARLPLDFDHERVARFNARSMCRDCCADAGIIRNRARSEAAIDNARRLHPRSAARSAVSTNTCWRFVDGRPRQHWVSAPRTDPSHSHSNRTRYQRTSRTAACDLSARRSYDAHMQAVGMVNDHLVKCFRCRRMCEGSELVIHSGIQPVTAPTARVVCLQHLMQCLQERAVSSRASTAD